MTIDEKIKQAAKGFIAELSGDCEYCDLNESSFERGANALKSEMLADMQKLADALEHYEGIAYIRCDGVDEMGDEIENEYFIADDALAEFNAKYKGQK